VLMGHSESGFFPEQAALADPSAIPNIKGLISIEMPCPELSPAQIATLAKIPTLVMFGDHLSDMPGGGPANWNASYESCQKFVQQMKDKGGDAEMMHLPKLGIKGNSHMLMQDRNNLQLADLSDLDRQPRRIEKGCRQALIPGLSRCSRGCRLFA